MAGLEQYQLSWCSIEDKPILPGNSCKYCPPPSLEYPGKLSSILPAVSIDRNHTPLHLQTAALLNSHACVIDSPPFGGGHCRHYQQSPDKTCRVRARNRVLFIRRVLLRSRLVRNDGRLLRRLAMPDRIQRLLRHLVSRLEPRLLPGCTAPHVANGTSTAFHHLAPVRRASPVPLWAPYLMVCSSVYAS